MFKATINLPEETLKELILEGLELTGIQVDALASVSFYYDRGDGTGREPGNGATAVISTMMAAHNVSIHKSQDELGELLYVALAEHGYFVYAPNNIHFHYSDGERNCSGSLSAVAEVPLPNHNKKQPA